MVEKYSSWHYIYYNSLAIMDTAAITVNASFCADFDPIVGVEPTQAVVLSLVTTLANASTSRESIRKGSSLLPTSLVLPLVIGFFCLFVFGFDSDWW